jgi:uncharacterized protein (TIGR02246 family)
MDPEGAVLDRIRALVSAWNAGDPRAFGAVFAEDAAYVSADGRRLCGRREIEDPLRDGQPTSAAVVGSPWAPFPAEGVARVVVRRSASAEARPGVVTCVLVRRDDPWLIDGLRNSDVA